LAFFTRLVWTSQPRHPFWDADCSSRRVPGPADETTDCEVQVVPVFAGNICDYRCQYTVLADACHAQALTVQMNFKCADCVLL